MHWIPIWALSLVASSMPAPLQHALHAARLHSHALGISRAQLASQEAATRQALAAMTPTLGLTGGYTRSQFATVLEYPIYTATGVSSLQSITVQPYNGLAATATLTVPLVNPTGIATYSGSRRALEAAQYTERASEADVLLSCATTYFQVVAAQGIVDAAERAEKTAQQSLAVAQAQHETGTANQLTVDRARVDLARAEQTLATGRQTLGVAQRSLQTITGEPQGTPLPALDDPQPGSPDSELSEEDCAAKAVQQRPELAQGQLVLAQREAEVLAAALQFAPQLTGVAQEHLTNAAGFVGHETYWTAGVNLSWTVDPVGGSAAISRAQAALQEQRARLAQQEDVVRDEVHAAWLAIEANRARLAATNSEVDSAREALELAQAQFKLGTATSLDLSTAQRDAFNAEATLAQARADLAAAMLTLQRATGVPLLEES